MARGLRIKYKDRIVPDAYHGTSLETARRIIREGRFKLSKGSHQFLGDGIYFYESSRWHAEKWASKRHENIGIICAVINLGKCLDLHNYEYIRLLKKVRKKLLQRGIPEITDAVVINFSAKQFEFDTVRATYSSRNLDKIFPGSKFWEYSQLIICVRNQDQILRFKLVFEGSVR